MLQKNKILRLYYDIDELNFGDALNSVLIQHLGGKEILAAGVKDCEMIAIGSLLGRFLSRRFSFKPLFRHPIMVWGSGYVEFGNRKDMHYLSRRMNIMALRGKATLEKFRKVHGAKIARNVVLGDPGLLSRELINANEIKKKYDLGIIPHYCDKNSPSLERIKVKNAKVIDIQQTPLDFLHDLAECRAVISSALHGIIAADSLGIPHIRMRCSTNIIGGDWKYNDYYSVFDIEHHDRVNLTAQDFTEADLAKLSCMPQDTIVKICERLKQVFPLKTKGNK